MPVMAWNSFQSGVRATGFRHVADNDRALARHLRTTGLLDFFWGGPGLESQQTGGSNRCDRFQIQEMKYKDLQRAVQTDKQMDTRLYHPMPEIRTTCCSLTVNKIKI